MYLEHFKLKEFPFSLTPNTAYFCNLPTYEEALNVLLTSLRLGEGFLKITGEVGVGKTTLCRKLLNSLGDKYITAYIPNPDLNRSGLRKALAKELGIPFSKEINLYELSHEIDQKLLSLHREGKRAIMIIDEAQFLSDEALEAIRLLSNLETESRKLLQIILFGQPELTNRLNQPNLRQLNQRITFSYELRPLNEEEICSYLCHRLSIAGHTQGNLFSRKACRQLSKLSKGIPRLINILAHKALIATYGSNEETVGVKKIRIAAQDTESIIMKTTDQSIWITMIFLLLVIAVSIEVYFILR